MPTLVTLPQEIQDRIWSYVIGRSVIHIMLDVPDPFPFPKHQTRISLLSESEASVRSGLYHACCSGRTHIYADMSPGAQNPKSPERLDGPVVSRICHRNCKVHPLICYDGSRIEWKAKGTPYLSVCKRLYPFLVEILYRNSIFSFVGLGSGRLAFAKFCSSLASNPSTLQSFSLRALHLEILAYGSRSWCYDVDRVMVDGAWQKLVDDEDQTGIKSLGSLQVLPLEILDFSTRPISLKCVLSWFSPSLGKIDTVPAVLAFGGLKNLGLRELHVAISPMGFGNILADNWVKRVTRVPWLKTKGYYAVGGQRGMERKLRRRLLGLEEENDPEGELLESQDKDGEESEEQSSTEGDSNGEEEDSTGD